MSAELTQITVKLTPELKAGAQAYVAQYGGTVSELFRRKVAEVVNPFMERQALKQGGVE